MLESIRIRNFVLIPSLELELKKGFTVLTGETGSGKSIILGALNLLLGGKADKEEIRAGEESAEINGVFSSDRPAVLEWLDGKGIECTDGEILIRRVVKSSGRSIYTINGSPVTVSEGQELGHLLVDISSQHSHQSLMKRDVQLSYLDSSAGNDRAIVEYRNEYFALRALEGERDELCAKIEKAQAEMEYNEYCFRELDSAKLEIGEDDRLKEELDIVASSEYLMTNLSEVSDALDEASTLLSKSSTILEKCIRRDPRLSEFFPRLESSEIEIGDILDSIKAHIGGFNLNEYEIEEKNERLALLQRLRKKYGGSIEGAIAMRDSLKEKLDYAQDSADLIDEMDRRIAEQRSKVERLATEIGSRRRKRAVPLSKEITAKLARLGMKNASFTVSVSPSQLGPNGEDRVDFLICPNKGEKVSLIEDSASGGELSRIMLALKSVFGNENDVETLVFDEIDAGIGGSTAYDVAAELVDISSSHQVIAISHLAQLASKAAHHLVVRKSVVGGRTVSTLEEISGDERIKEIARLLSGDASDISLEHAARLLEVQ